MFMIGIEGDTESSVAGITPHTTRLFGTVTPEPDNQPNPINSPPRGFLRRAPNRLKENRLTQRGFAPARRRKHRLECRRTGALWQLGRELPRPGDGEYWPSRSAERIAPRRRLAARGSTST